MIRALILFYLVFSFNIINAQKNILFISVDDLKPMFNSYGHEDMITPNIDALAAKGTSFLNTSTQQAICAPSRASLLTGLYPDNTRVWDLETQIRDENPNVVTLPQHFKDNGYFSVGLGKIFDNRSVDNNYDGKSWSTQFLQGMPNQYYHSNDAGKSGYQDPLVHQAINQYNSYISSNNITSTNGKREARKLFPLSKPSTEGNQDLPDDGYVDGARTNYALIKMEEAANSGKPFFLAVGYTKPHLPFVAPKKYWDMYDRSSISIHPEQGRDSSIPSIAFHNNHELVNNYSDIPSNGNITVDKQKELIHGYKACVSYVDAQVGILLSKLDELGLSSNTIVVLWGDHGWHLGDHGLWIKHTNFEQAVSSPMIIYSPDHGLENNMTNSPVELLDIYPTLCDLAGISIPNEAEGKSVKEVMNDPDHKVRHAALAQYTRMSNGKRVMGYSLRDERYRYTKWVQMDYRNGERYGTNIACEFYDYEIDSFEKINRCSDDTYSDIIAGFELEFKRRNIAQSSPSNFLSVTTCGQSYTAPDNSIYSESGIYTAKLVADNGMDSVITIELILDGQLSNNVYVTNGQLVAEQQESDYQWYSCSDNLPVDGQNAISFQPEESGSYYVIISHPDCGVVQSECVSFNQVLSAEKENLKNYNLFPNPVDDILSIYLNRSYEDISLKLVDISGKIFLKGSYKNKSKIKLNVSNLKGQFIFLISLDGDEQKKTNLIIQ
tara:strand:+ start:1436 stop:3598 length:2163 start_codon:yes stop_codon:yes gene_type:complete